ncbi:sciellin isoform X4 [Ailuropoda melanoleuca]|uniref:sciellin isoform X4 n=1 Tax=Ailuropoda melanoleuca TaxID=9646 RepID=UPI001493E445|nr:sciellin isoform X4 [Ailuropoda melanoleuca]
MSNFTSRKVSPTGNDMKSTTQGITLRQQGFHEVNKRRTFLQDNSWIKKRPEEEKDENYGRVVLNRHNSHDALDRKVNERDEPKATISRYRSDDTLDRISDRNDATKTYKANTLDNRLTNRNTSTFRSPEAAKTQPGDKFSASAASTPAPSSATTPVKRKRQSWFPPPPPGYSTTPSMGAGRRGPTVHPPTPPKPSSSVSSPNQLRRENRQICPPKPGVYTETNRSAERNIRSQDLENVVKVATSLQKTNKGEELDNLIKMNKNLNRNQGLDGLFRTNPKAEQTEKRAKSLENLIFMNTRTDKDGKGNQGLGSLINQRTDKNEKGQDLETIIKVNARMDKTRRGGEDLDNLIKAKPKGSENATGKQDLDGFIKVNPETNKNIKRGQSLDNLIKVTPEVNRSNAGSKDLDNLIKVVPRTGKTMRGGQSLDSLIKVSSETNGTNQSRKEGLDELINVSPKAVKNMTRNQDLDKLIRVNPETLTNNRRNQDLDNLIKVSPAVTRSSQSEGLDNLIKVKSSALSNPERDQDPKNVIEVNSNVPKNKNGRLDGQVNGSTDALNKQLARTPAHSYEAGKNLSFNAETRHAGPKDTFVYTRTYVENSKSLKDGYQENISGKYIQTVYSTSDRSVIERDMCTYCRKPLGTETKMILDELQICCHSTCFKCEICKQPLENLQAGDSIWIYRQTIHCEPCYSKVMAKWIQ